IIAGAEGEYFPLNFGDNNSLRQLNLAQAGVVIDKIRELLNGDEIFRAEFSGSLMQNKANVNELAGVLAISLLLLYFILASQFESVSIPLIVLLEVPIDIIGAFLILKLFSSSINLISIIGIVVMSGIIMNDCSLTIDTVIQRI